MFLKYLFYSIYKFQRKELGNTNYNAAMGALFGVSALFFTNLAAIYIFLSETTGFVFFASK